MIINFRNYGVRPTFPEAISILSQKNLHFFANIFSKYFEKEIISAEKHFNKLNDFILLESKATDIIERFITPLANYENYNISLDNIYQNIQNSLDFRETYITSLNVKDIIYLQNFLKRNKSDISKITLRGAEDPLAIIIKYLCGDDDFEIDIDAYAFELLQYKLNFKLNTKMFAGLSEMKINNGLFKCTSCSLLYPYYLLTEEDFNKVFQEEDVYSANPVEKAQLDPIFDK